MIKDLDGTIVPIFRIEVELNLFTSRPLHNKLHDVCELAAEALKKTEHGIS